MGLEFIYLAEDRNSENSVERFYVEVDLNLLIGQKFESGTGVYFFSHERIFNLFF